MNLLWCVGTWFPTVLLATQALAAVLLVFWFFENRRTSRLVVEWTRASWFTHGLVRVQVERRRQVLDLGHRLTKDSGYKELELPWAAWCYAHPACNAGTPMPEVFPWGSEHWKPSDDPVRNLERAAALLVAEIDRLRPDSPINKHLLAEESIERACDDGHPGKPWP